MVLPLVKHPFIVGFLVAELPNVEAETCMNSESTQGEVPNLPQSNYTYGNSLEIQPYQEDLVKTCQITLEERSRAVRISQSLATAYVMDQVRLITFPFYSSFSYTRNFLWLFYLFLFIFACFFIGHLLFLIHFLLLLLLFLFDLICDSNFFFFFSLFQKAMLLQQTSWQNNVRMSQLVEQVISFSCLFRIWGYFFLCRFLKS